MTNGSFLGGLASGFADTLRFKKEQERLDKIAKLQGQLIELQLKDRQQAQAGLDQLTSLAEGSVGEFVQTGTGTTALGEFPRFESTGRDPRGLIELLSDPDGQLAAIKARLIGVGDIPRLDSFGARKEFAAQLQNSGMTPEDFIKTSQGSSLAVRAGMSPQKFLESQGGFRPTANIQDFQFAQGNPEFLPFLQDRNQAASGGSGLGRAFSKAYEDIQNAGLVANRTINMNNRMLQLNDLIQTGRLAPAKTLAAEIAQSFGIDVEGLDATQAFRALSNRVALELRNPAGGAGMPGAMSDRDRQFLIDAVPGLTLTPEGNRLIAEYAIKLAERDKAVFAQARAYLRQHGALDERFFDELELWSNQNPLFTDEDIRRAGGATNGTAPQPNVIRYDSQGNRLD